MATGSKIEHHPVLLKTPLLDNVSCDIFLDRFRKEITIPFRINLSRKVDRLSKDVQLHRTVFMQRVTVGVNTCAKILEGEVSSLSIKNDEKEGVGAGGVNKVRSVPMLVVLVNTTTAEDTLCLAHIVSLCHSCKVPILLLPSKSGSTTTSLGRALGIRRASVITFLSQGDAQECPKMQSGMDSFIKHWLGMVRTT